MNQDQLFKQEQLFKLTTNNGVRQAEKIVVFGVGGGGGNALNHIIESNVQGVDFVAANTDARALDANQAPNKIILGETLTRGLGAGAEPTVGANAAKESIDRIKEYITGADMLFVTAGMGGGTGTGAAPVIAQAAKDLKVLVVGVVTLPFGFEMKRRMNTALAGVEELRKSVDALLVVENDKLLDLAGNNMKIVDAYKKVDEVLRQAVQGVTDLITKSGFVNLDFADIKTVLTGAGTAIMGMGEGEGDNRAVIAAQKAIESPLMSFPVEGAKGILMNVTTGTEITLKEMSDAAKIIEETADEDAQVIWGHVIDESLEEKVHVTLIATFPENSQVQNINNRTKFNVKKGASSEKTQSDRAQQPAQRPAPQAAAPQTRDPRAGRSPVRSIYEVFNENKRGRNLEVTSLTQFNEDDKEPFKGVPRRSYDQPSFFRKTNKN